VPHANLDQTELERLTRAYGQELFARVDRQGPTLLGPLWWDERMMDWTMADPAVKVQLFRFIDVLPQLGAAPVVARHLREYFEEAGDNLPGWARFGLQVLPARGVPARLLAGLARTGARRLARKFIAGSNLTEALAAIAELRRRRLAFTVDLLGEATITEKEAEKTQRDILELVEGLSAEVNAWPPVLLIDADPGGPLPRVNISVKLSSLYSQFDPIDPEGTSTSVRERLRPILRAAMRRGVFINVDMEQYAFKDQTLRIFREILDEAEFRDWPNIGIAIQAYLQSCGDDLHGLLDWVQRRGTPVWVRLIKGAYWDYETVVSAQEGWPVPVYAEKWQTDANYERQTLFLLENHRWLRPAFGSHNIRSLAYAIAAAQLIGLPDNAYEIQMLYGMADPIKDALVRLGRRVRVYTPYGQLLPGMAYLVRRLLENTANTSFLRASFSEHVPEEKLLMNPNNVPVLDGRLRVTGPPPRTTDIFHNEPISDFSREDAREAMRQALADVRKQLGKTYPPIIDGKAVLTPATFDSVNPSHQREIVGRCGRPTPEIAKQAINAAQRALPMWRDTDAAARADYLERTAAVLRRRRYELAAWEVFECAKPWREADADIAEAIDFCAYYAHEMRRLARLASNNLPGEDNAYLYEPRGVAVVIAPWNFPLAILCGMSVAAIVSGCPTIIKPAEQSSVIGAKLMEALQDAGLPPGVAQYLPGIGEEIGPTLAEHPDVAVIAFTGSRGVGLVLNREAAVVQPGQTHIKRLIAELGGKNGIIVDDDADLDEAVAGVAASAFTYSGQKCSACSRAIVLETVYDTFLERLIEATKSLKIGPAEDAGTKVGPVIDGDARERILGYLAKGKQESRLAYAGDIGFLAAEGYYVAPHIFAEVPPTAVIAQEEIFGPVLAVMKVRDLDEALRVANGTQYALTGGLYSRSPANIERVRREFRVGNLYINRKITGALVGRQPFGGFKMSGIGSKAGGPDYLLQFLLPRTITENTMRRGFAPTTEPLAGRAESGL
jgi:RHH-type proline utilization regulon transcriptional repressor/proline dehydrogenase/delta 1-pyrroline-5-carboxylate dehydrogenase